MKIALIIERLDPIRGGRETYTVQIAAELAARGHDVTVLCQSAAWERGDSPVHVVELGRRGLRRVVRLRSFVADVQGELGTGRYDVSHAMLPVPGASLYHPHGGAIPASMEGSLRRRGKIVRPIARRLKGLNRARAASAALEREIVEDTGATVLCVSGLVAEQFGRYYGLQDRARVVFNGVDVPDPASEQRVDWRQEVRFKLGVTARDPVFLTVATNFELKGVQESIVAFARWLHSRDGAKNARLVIVGREMVEGYHRFAGMRDVGRWVVFVPPTREIFRWYAAADAFVLLTWYDPCSLTVLEAARWGIPSLTTRFNGAAEAFADGGCVVVDSPRETKAAAEALAELADPQRRDAHAIACGALSDSLSLTRHVDELLVAYDEAARKA